MSEFQRQFVSILKKRFEEEAPLIQVLMGPRQVGKTTGVLQFLEGYDQSYHYCTADDIIAGGRQWILEQWQSALLKGAETLLVIDEIQKIYNWSETIKKLWDEQRLKNTHIKLLILGSSSLSLNLGVSESLAGRFEQIAVSHWDYYESYQYCGLTVDEYLTYGGYPKAYEYRQEHDRYIRYLGDAIINRVIDNDILQFASIKNPSLFRQAFEIICCYPSQIISYRKILGQLQDKGNTDLIKHYLKLFEGAYLIKTLQKYGSQDFKIKSSSPKILLLSPCFYTLFSTHNEKKEFVFESTVGAKLLQLSPELYYWREGNDEVDFILQWRHHIFAIEVKSGRKRKSGGLDVFSRQYPKAIPIIISKENYAQFSASPVDFFEILM